MKLKKHVHVKYCFLRLLSRSCLSVIKSVMKKVFLWQTSQLMMGIMNKPSGHKDVPRTSVGRPFGTKGRTKGTSRGRPGDLKMKRFSSPGGPFGTSPGRPRDVHGTFQFSQERPWDVLGTSHFSLGTFGGRPRGSKQILFRMIMSL